MYAEYMEFLEDNEELWKVYDQSDVAGTPVVATNTPDDPSTTVATPTDTIHVDSDPPASFVVIRWLNVSRTVGRSALKEPESNACLDTAEMERSHGASTQNFHD